MAATTCTLRARIAELDNFYNTLSQADIEPAMAQLGNRYEIGVTALKIMIEERIASDAEVAEIASARLGRPVSASAIWLHRPQAIKAIAEATGLADLFEEYKALMARCGRFMSWDDLLLNPAVNQAAEGDKVCQRAADGTFIRSIRVGLKK